MVLVSVLRLIRVTIVYSVVYFRDFYNNINKNQHNITNSAFVRIATCYPGVSRGKNGIFSTPVMLQCGEQILPLRSKR